MSARERELTELLEIAAVKTMLTKQDLAIRYQVSEKTIRRWIRTGYLPRGRWIHGPRWSAKQIQQWEKGKHANT
jgi:transposase